MSLGLDFHLTYELDETKLETYPSLTTGIHKVFEQIHDFKQKPTQENYTTLMNTYLSVGQMLNFTEEDIFDAYLEKNKVNHERQHSGY